MPSYLLDKTYRVGTASGISYARVVVQGSAGGECVLPASANAGGILGVSVHSQPELGRGITIRKAGIVEVVASGPIPVGAPVNIAGATGKIKAINETSGTKVECIGYAEKAAFVDGDIIDVFLSIHQRTA